MLTIILKYFNISYFKYESRSFSDIKLNFTSLSTKTACNFINSSIDQTARNSNYTATKYYLDNNNKIHYSSVLTT